MRKLLPEVLRGVWQAGLGGHRVTVSHRWCCSGMTWRALVALGKEIGCRDVVGKTSMTQLLPGQLPWWTREGKGEEQKRSETEPLAFQVKAAYIIVRYSVYKWY